MKNIPKNSAQKTIKAIPLTQTPLRQLSSFQPLFLQNYQLMEDERIHLQSFNLDSNNLLNFKCYNTNLSTRNQTPSMKFTQMEDLVFEEDENQNIFQQFFQPQSCQTWTFELSDNLEDLLTYDFTTKVSQIPKINKKKINKLSLQQKNDESVYCQHCPKTFETKYQLGGHMSKSHKGKSETYKHKIAVREKRSLKRKSMKILQHHSYQRYLQAQMFVD